MKIGNDQQHLLVRTSISLVRPAQPRANGDHSFHAFEQEYNRPRLRIPASAGSDQDPDPTRPVGMSPVPMAWPAYSGVTKTGITRGTERFAFRRVAHRINSPRSITARGRYWRCNSPRRTARTMVWELQPASAAASMNEIRVSPWLISIRRSPRVTAVTFFFFSVVVIRAPAFQSTESVIIATPTESPR